MPLCNLYKNDLIRYEFFGALNFLPSVASRYVHVDVCTMVPSFRWGMVFHHRNTSHFMYPSSLHGYALFLLSVWFFLVFCLLVLLNEAAVNILAWISWWTCTADSLGCILEGELLTCGVCICSTLQSSAKLFSKMTVVVSTPSSDVSEFPLLYIRTRICQASKFLPE